MPRSWKRKREAQEAGGEDIGTIIPTKRKEGESRKRTEESYFSNEESYFSKEEKKTKET